jgi:hypothetical protein
MFIVDSTLLNSYILYLDHIQGLGLPIRHVPFGNTYWQYSWLEVTYNRIVWEALHGTLLHRASFTQKVTPRRDMSTLSMPYEHGVFVVVVALDLCVLGNVTFVCTCNLLIGHYS